METHKITKILRIIKSWTCSHKITIRKVKSKSILLQSKSLLNSDHRFQWRRISHERKDGNEKIQNRTRYIKENNQCQIMEKLSLVSEELWKKGKEISQCLCLSGIRFLRLCWYSRNGTSTSTSACQVNSR